jgi:hypothetical protein
MPFPISYSKKLILNKDIYQISRDTLIRNILIVLQIKEASKAHNNGNMIFFKGGIRLVNSFNILIPISSGSITVEEIDNEFHINFALSFTQLLIFTTFIIPIFFGIALSINTELKFIEITSFILLAWLLIFGANYLFTIIRFPRFIIKSISSK